jgi:hypothetical protein
MPSPESRGSLQFQLALGLTQKGWSYEQWLQQHESREVRPSQALGTAA